MRFFASRHDIVSDDRKSDGSAIDQYTSVKQVKAFFFDSLRLLGSIDVIDEAASISELRCIFAQPDVVLVSVHTPYNSSLYERLSTVPKRSLWHSLGGLMLPEPLAMLVAKSSNRVSLVQNCEGSFGQPMSLYVRRGMRTKTTESRLVKRLCAMCLR